MLGGELRLPGTSAISPRRSSRRPAAIPASPMYLQPRCAACRRDRGPRARAGRCLRAVSSRRVRGAHELSCGCGLTSSGLFLRSTCRPSRSSACSRIVERPQPGRAVADRFDQLRPAALITLYNLYPSATIVGGPAAGSASMAAMEEIAHPHIAKRREPSGHNCCQKITGIAPSSCSSLCCTGLGSLHSRGAPLRTGDSSN